MQKKYFSSWECQKNISWQKNLGDAHENNCAKRGQWKIRSSRDGDVRAGSWTHQKDWWKAQWRNRRGNKVKRVYWRNRTTQINFNIRQATGRKNSRNWSWKKNWLHKRKYPTCSRRSNSCCVVIKCTKMHNITPWSWMREHNRKWAHCSGRGRLSLRFIQI